MGTATWRPHGPGRRRKNGAGPERDPHERIPAHTPGKKMLETKKECELRIRRKKGIKGKYNPVNEDGRKVRKAPSPKSSPEVHKRKGGEEKTGQ